MLTIAIFMLLHVLVFVYWLGGDLGAFYASRYLTAADVPKDRRLFAAKIVGDVDMAPRTALILTLPTGLGLAEIKGWVALGWPLVTVLSVLSLTWVALVWHLHFAGTARSIFRQLDLGIRWFFAASLIVGGAAGLFGIFRLPLFLTLKCFALGACVVLGLLVRRQLKPLFPALMTLAGSDIDEGAEATIRQTLSQARPLVVVIWLLLLAAAFLGIWAPIQFI